MVCRYRKWDLGGNIKVVARCKLDAYMHTTMGEALVNIKACNEWDSKVCHTHACMHLHTHIHTLLMHMCTHMHLHTHAPAHTCTCTHTCSPPQSVAALIPLYCNGWSVCREYKSGWVGESVL